MRGISFGFGPKFRVNFIITDKISLLIKCTAGSHTKPLLVVVYLPTILLILQETFTDSGKIWVRHYEIDVTGTVEAQYVRKK